MKRLKPILILFTVSGLVFCTCCQNSAEGKKAESRKTPVPVEDTTYTLHLTPEQKAAILARPRNKQLQQELSIFYNKQLLRTGFNGGIIVAKKGVVLFEQYHGIEDLSSRQPISDSSTFQMASVSKTFTAMGILWLMEHGKLNLDDNVQLYIPDFPYNGITIRLLLSHRSGLPNYLYFCETMVKDKGQFLSNQDVIDLMIKNKPAIHRPPNRGFEYNNTNFMLLGSIIEKVSGMKYADFLQQTFFTPIGMHSTFVYNPTAPKRPHQTVSMRGNRQEPDTYFDGVIGDKGIYSSVPDMLKWDQALYSGNLFKPETLEAAYRAYSHERPGIRNYGLGWHLMIHPDSSKIVYHNGWWHGNNLVFTRFVEDTTTIIILGNKYNTGIYHAVAPISEILGHSDAADDGEDASEGTPTTAPNAPITVADSSKNAILTPVPRVPHRKSNLHRKSATTKKKTAGKPLHRTTTGTTTIKKKKK
ncbi:serine hydrolase domain-containing protein [Chitinophaga costaii]|nr:serine hydrolase domain-containing protein [Chitinophaga costaii]